MLEKLLIYLMASAIYGFVIGGVADNFVDFFSLAVAGHMLALVAVLLTDGPLLPT